MRYPIFKLFYRSEPDDDANTQCVFVCVCQCRFLVNFVCISGAMS